MQFNIITNNKEWDEAVNQLENASIYHTSAWKSLLEQHGSKGFLVVAEDNGSVAGILPLFITKSMLFGFTQFYSIPLCGQNGLLMSENSKSIFKAILDGWMELKKEYNPSRTIIQTDQFLGLRANIIPCYKYIFKINGLTADQILKNVLSKWTRKKISKAKKRNVTVSLGNHDPIIKEYYSMYMEVMHRRGISIGKFSEKFFQGIFKILKENIILLVARKDNNVLGAGISFRYKDTLYKWGLVSHVNALKYYPNDLLNWEAIRYASENGLRCVDFDICPLGGDIGLHSKKEKYSTDKENVFIVNINHHRKAIIEDSIFSTGKCFKSLFLKSSNYP